MKSLTKLSLCLFAALILAGCGKSARVEKDMGPAETITHTAHSIAKNDPGAAWVMLPKSYRADINGLFHTIGEKMPADNWDKAFSLVGRLGKALESKKSYIVESAGNLPKGMTKADVEYSVESFGKILVSLSKSDLAKVAKLKKIDLGNFADSTLTEIIKQINNEKFKKVFQGSTGEGQPFIDSFKKIKAELVSESGDSATVKVTDPKGKEEEVKLVKIEGKWLPEDMPKGFKKGMDFLKSNLESNLDKIKDLKPQITVGLSTFEGIVTNIEKAGSAKEMQAALSASPFNPMDMITRLPKARARAKEAQHKMNLKNIGNAANSFFADGTHTEFDGTWEQIDIKRFNLNADDYHKFFYKGQAFKGTDEYVLACEKKNIIGDGINVVLQDARVIKIMGDFKSLDDIKKALKAKGYKGIQ